jgi:hypothetical protein
LSLSSILPWTVEDSPNLMKNQNVRLRRNIPQIVFNYLTDSIREPYPTGITALELAGMTGLPIKTGYAQLRELCRENLVTELPKQQTGRGRPKTTGDDPAGTRQQQRQRSRYIIEDTMGIYHSHTEDVEKKKILPPGHVLYSNDFLYLRLSVLTICICALYGSRFLDDQYGNEGS